MRNLWLVARKEFVSRGKSGAYIVTTLLVVASLFFATLAPTFMEKKSKTEPLTVMVLDQTGGVGAQLQAMLKASGQQPDGRAITLEAVTGDEATLKEQARKSDRALLVVEGTFPSQVKARFLAASPGLLSGAGAVLGPLEAMVRAARIQQAGLDPNVAAEILKPMQTEVAQLTTRSDSGERDKDAWLGSFLLAMGIVMALYMVVLINGQFVFMGVLEEKVSRVMEVMASNVSASTMMAGKVLGLGALGLIQFLATILSWFVANEIARSMTDMPAGRLNLGTALLALTFLVLGYILTSTLMAAAAATISRMEDQQVVATPITLLVALPMMLVPTLMNNPDSSFAITMSLIPFFSQSVMVFRVLMTDVPTWQVGLSLGLMVVTTLFMTWASGRVYRAAMLSYGSRPSLKQVWQYLKLG